jgi:diguanylate cyclase (GGDEF)-like protein
MIRVVHLRTRVILFFVTMLALIEVVSFALVNASNSHNATVRIEGELEVGQHVFARLLRQNAQTLSQSARLLTADFAFREAVATGDPGTIAAALANHGDRNGAEAMLYVGLDGKVVADTLEDDRVPRAFEHPELLERATITGAAAGIEMLAGHGFQLVAIALRAPVRLGWVVLGFPVDTLFARDLRQLTSLDVSFFMQDGQAARHDWHSLASTLDDAADSELRGQLPLLAIPFATHIVRIHGTDHQARLISLTATGGRRIVAVLHRSLSEALAAFDRLRTTLIALAIMSLFVATLGCAGIALNITRPLGALAKAAARMEAGDYSSEVDIQRADEIGSLAYSLNQMRESIAEREQRILTLAYRDQLTGLANRAQFSEMLAAAITAARPGTEAVAIFVMDLDRFKYVNDTLGHGVGDHVLRQVASRLTSVVPSSGCVARLGGDEFALLLTGAAAAKVVDAAKAIVAALEQPVLYEGQPLDVGTSVGIARFPQHGRDARTLVRNADVAMYVAKRNKTGLAIYNAYYDTTQQEHLSLLGELRSAVEQRALRLVYQPKVSLRSSNVSAVEALIRWIHPERGTLLPAHFIPFAEATGFIKVLTRWVLAEVVRQCAEWLSNGLQLQISANISARDLMNRDLPDQIAALLAEHCVPAGLICLEITESGFMEDPAHAQKVLDRLSAMGLRLAIDDYGVGYSSLSHIMKLPVQELKIDRSFIAGMVTNPDLSSVVRSTIELGHNLGMTVVAEGVEDSNGWDLLESLGCDDAQGYFMSPPLEAAALVQWMHEHDGIDILDTTHEVSTGLRGHAS